MGDKCAKYLLCCAATVDGRRREGTGGGEPSHEARDDASETSDFEAKVKLGEAATARLRNFATIVQGLPVQTGEQVEPFPQITAAFFNVKKMTSEHELKQFEDKIDLHYLQANQFVDMLQDSAAGHRNKNIQQSEACVCIYIYIYICVYVMCV